MFLTEDAITAEYQTALKVNPPLRTAEDAAALIEGLANGTIDAIVTDHAPHTDWEKDREFELAPFGMTGRLRPRSPWCSRTSCAPASSTTAA